MTKRRTTLMLASLPLLLALAACSSTGSGASAGASPASGGKGPDYDYGGGGGASEAPSVAAVGELVIGTGSGAVGAYLTGPNGLTLYTFAKDSENTSACSGDCATAWPSLTTQAGETIAAGDGVPGALSTFTRGDGAQQVSYNGKPLYYFASDKAAGDTTGDGLNDVWFVAEP